MAKDDPTNTRLQGLRRGLTNYGDRAFSLYLRRSFARSMGYSPAMLDRPALQLVVGQMMTSRFRGERLGGCTDCRRFWGQYRGGKLSDAEIEAIEGNLATTGGTCAVMGTASTMACLAEALGMALPGSAAIPAVHADRLRAAEATGATAVAPTRTRLTPEGTLTPAPFRTALRGLLATGGPA